MLPKQSPINLPACIRNNDDPARSAPDLEAGYRAMAEDAEGEAEAMEWIESLINDCAES